MHNIHELLQPQVATSWVVNSLIIYPQPAPVCVQLLKLNCVKQQRSVLSLLHYTSTAAIEWAPYAGYCHVCTKKRT